MKPILETSLTWLARLTSGPHDHDWRRLDEFYGPLLETWLARAGVALSDRDDLKQEVFMVVARRIQTFDRRHPGAFRGWLRSILKNKLKKYFFNHRKRTCLIAIDELTIDDSQLAKHHDHEHDLYVANRAISIVRSDFSNESWLAFQRHVLQGQSSGETAKELGISINAVLKAKSRILKRIRVTIESWTSESLSED